MHIVYMDDAQDEKGGAFSALIIPEETWQECFDQFRDYRRQLKMSDGIFSFTKNSMRGSLSPVGERLLTA